MSEGVFITLEGGEGAGKSTQAELLRDKLIASGHDATITREPGGSALGEAIRTLLLSGTNPLAPLVEALLFNAARVDHLEQVIRPALAAGRWVICDRFADSTRVYQGLAGGVDVATLLALEDIALAQTRPSLTLVFDLPAEEGLKRAERRRQTERNTHVDRFEARDIAFHTQLREGFLQIARNEPNRCVVVDASKDVDAVARQVWSIVEERFLT